MKKKKTSAPNFSESICGFLSMVEQAQRDYDWSVDEQRKMENLTSDYLHQLELGNLKYEDRAKIATKLADCRKRRRECKNTVSALEPFVEFIRSDRGRQMINLTKEALGKTRKAEERLVDRIYYPRELEIPPIRDGQDIQLKPGKGGRRK